MKRLQEALSRARTVTVTTHTSPDGDAIGSALAMGRALRAMGKQVTVAGHDPLPPDLAFLPDAESWQPPPDLPPQDVCLMVDVCGVRRIGTVERIWKEAAVRACIDHHMASPDPDVAAYLDPRAASCAQLALDVIDALGVRVDREIATLIFAGLSTDTGHFVFANADERVFSTAARMVAHGVDVADFAYRVYRVKNLAKTRLMGACLASLEMRAEGRIAVMSLMREDYLRYGAIDSDTEGLVNLGLEIHGVDAAILARESAEGDEVRISLRTSERVDAAAVCREFEGGGHVRAAGCIFKMPIDQACIAVVAAVERELAR